jgi:hypothetical protein
MLPLRHLPAILILPLFLFVPTNAVGQQQPEIIVSTKYGKLRGFVHSPRDAVRKMDVFFGIPYATAPLDKLRFEACLLPLGHLWRQPNYLLFLNRKQMGIYDALLPVSIGPIKMDGCSGCGRGSKAPGMPPACQTGSPGAFKFQRGLPLSECFCTTPRGH